MQESLELSNKGVRNITQNNFNLGLDLLKKAYSLDKNNLHIKNNLLLAFVKYGQDCLSKKQVKKFLNSYKECIDMGIANDEIVKTFVSAKTHFCDWEDLDRYKSLDPYESILRFPDEMSNLLVARSYSEKFSNRFLYKKHNHKKIKIAYLSNGFRDFPTGHNLIDVIENHDRSKFEIYCYSWGEDDGSDIRKRFRLASNFVDITNLSDVEAASKIAFDEIDILIDLKGHTDNNRFEILSFKPATLIINYLGYPGTTGAEFVDFIIADKTVLPPSSKKYYSEKVIYLDGCYRPIVCHCEEPKRRSNLVDRSQRSARDDKFVFASFNMSYKITPEVFLTWIEILKSVPNSVLWLHKSNHFFSKNLNKFAKLNGLDYKRIIYKEDLPHDKHLERLREVNIGLDTYPVNGHSTTVDCLTMGVPVVTLKGSHFTSRVSESVLKTYNLEFLVAKDLDQYKKIAVNFSQENLSIDFNPPSIKAYIKNLEKAYNEAYDRKSLYASSTISRRR